MTKYTDFFCWKNEESFCTAKLLTFFQQKYWCIWDINVWNFNETLRNDVVSFEQPGPDLLVHFDLKAIIREEFKGIAISKSTTATE